VLARAHTSGCSNTVRRSIVAQTGSTQPGTAQATGKAAIRPFQIPDVSDAELTDLKKRINATRWPERETVADITQGTQLATMQKVAKYWANDYDWRKCEAKLKALPHFITEIDGMDIHFIHVQSKHEDALPLIVTHGWPGSIVEQLKIIEPLTNPTAHGGKASDAFHLVIPSIPGYGYSGKPSPTNDGWDPAKIARAWSVLMKRLGYDQYVAQGGDWGAVITETLATQAPPELLGIHVNMPSAVPPDILKAVAEHAPPPAGLSADEKRAYEQLTIFLGKHLGYAIMQATRPQTLTGLADSPIGLAAFLLDHDDRSLELKSRTFDGKPEGITRDDVLDNATLFWLTNTAISAARLYWEFKGSFFAPFNVKIPVAVSAFPDELYQCPKSWAEKVYPKLIHYNRLPKGGHFAAWEQPQHLVDEVRTGLRSLRS
jgi:pimeloyl-ACP methyl ester carboxylesterase